MTVLPSTMRAIVIDGKGGPEVLKLADVPVPAPGPGQILVQVAAAGVNRPDVAQRQGAYPPPPGPNRPAGWAWGVAVCEYRRMIHALPGRP